MELKVFGIAKLLEYVVVGVGAVTGSMLAPWRARREAIAKRIHAEADADVRVVQAEAEATSLQIIASAQAKARELLLSSKDQMHGDAELSSNLVTQKIEFQERKRISNVRSVVSHAAEQLADIEVDNHPPDPDWTARFFDCVQDVSSEDMQRLWARLLSGEVKRPGSITLRTMDVVRNMTTAEAKLFQSLCSFVLEEKGFGIVFHLINKRDEFPELHHVNLLRCQDSGLLNIAKTTYTFSTPGHLTSNNLVLKMCDVGKKTMPIEVATLTNAGRELCRISDVPTNEHYLRMLANDLREKDNDFRLLYATIVQRESGMVRHNNDFQLVS